MKALPIAFAAITLAGCEIDHQGLINTTVKVENSQDNGHGSAVHIGFGAFITAEHVIRGKEEVTLRFENGLVLDGSVERYDDQADIAVVFVENYDGPYARLRCDYAELGEEVIAAGNPLTEEFVLTFGRISGNAKQNDFWRSTYRIDNDIAPGSSGGPLFDLSGQVVGINVGVGEAQGMMRDRTYYGLSYSVPSKEVCDFLGRV